MKIGIVTLYGNDNYGNKLQNYALQEFLKELNVVPKTLINYIETNDINNYIKSKVKKICKKNNCYRNSNPNRLNCFLKFNELIDYDKNVLTIFNSKKIQKEYDYFIVGSDQVWNNHYAMNYIELLGFAPCQKRLSYAASMGYYDISQKRKIKLLKELKKFNLISVREKQAKDYLLNLNPDLNIHVNVDPTLLISKSKWKSLSKKPKFKIPSDYLLIYFLGDIPEITRSKIIKYAKDNKLEIINLMDKNSAYYETGPLEFLYLIEKAKYIFTDSYHCIIFSIIFHNNFSIFDRNENGISSVNNMNSRIETLLEHFSLEKCKNNYNNNIDYKNVDNIIENDYRDSKALLLSFIGRMK